LNDRIYSRLSPHRLAGGAEPALCVPEREEAKEMKLAIVAGLALTTSLLAIDNEPAKRLGEAATVFSEIMAAPDKGIPQDLLEKAYCIVIVPSLKTASFYRRREIRQGISVVPQ
jgi:lipid-binding SYLF domain-containing protein